MADNPQEHTGHQQSLAYLADAGKVTGFEFDQKEHITKNPSDLQQVVEAQVVTTKRDSYMPDEQQPIDLQSGPPKKYIDQPNDQQQQQQNTVPLSNFAHANLEDNENQNANNNQQNNVDAFIPPTNENDKQNYESFFGDENNNNIEQNDNANNGISAPTDNTNDIFGDINNEQEQDNIIEEKKEEKQTFLSVWQEQHREQLEQKGKEERETQDKLLETAKEELNNFTEKRRQRIEQQRKDAQSRESDLREDYNSVFKHGTVWQQVAKLVDLKADKKETERMKDLLIILKNQDEKKSDQ